MKAIELPPQSAEPLKALDEVYQITKDVRLRTRAQMMLLAAEKGLTAPEIAKIVRDDEQTVRRWMKRYMAEGIEGLKDAPKPRSPGKVTRVRRKAIGCRAATPTQFGFTLLDLDTATFGGLYG